MNDTLDQLRKLDPVLSRDPVRAAGADTLTELADQIALTDPDPAVLPISARRRAITYRAVPALVAASLIGAIVFTSVDLSGGSRNEALGPALSFQTDGDAVKVTINDLNADSERLKSELREHQINLQIDLVPVSPSQVGTNFTRFEVDSGGASTSFDFETVPAGCRPAGTPSCSVQIRVSTAEGGRWVVVVGRPMKPGEHPFSAADIGEKGEALSGVKYQGLQVSEVRQLLADRGYTVSSFTARIGNDIQDRTEVPDSWFVTQGQLATDKEVVLTVQPRRP